MQRPLPKKTATKVEKSPVIEQTPVSPFSTILLKALIIIFAGLFVAAPAFHGDWLWDDDQAITANPLLQAPNGVWRIWKAPYTELIEGQKFSTVVRFALGLPTPDLIKKDAETGADYWPLTTTVHWVVYHFFKANSTAYHVLNAILHVISGLLIWRLFFKFGIRCAWLGGLIFVVHPVLVESVAWVSELKNTLSLPFLIASMIAFINYDNRGKTRYLVWSILFFALSALAKTSVVMYPIFLLLYLWWKHGPMNMKDFEKPGWMAPWIKGLLAVIPYFIIAYILGRLTIHFQHSKAIGTEVIPVGGLVSRISMAGQAILFYLKICIWPFTLLPIYPRWVVDPPKLIQFYPWPILLVTFIWCWIKRNTWGKHLILAFGFFILALIPVLGFIDMSYMRITWVADHFVYLPLLGPLALIVAGIGWCYDKVSAENKNILIVVGCLVFGVLACWGHRYSNVFVDESAMWSYTLKSNPDAWQAHSRYGKVKIDRGELDAAFYHITQANRLRPDLAETHNNLAAMLEQKDPDKALYHLREAYRIEPNLPVFRVNLANLLVRQRYYEEARGHYVDLLKTNPNNLMFHCNYGVTLYFLGHNDEAIKEFQAALKINPDHKDSRANLKVALDKKNGISSTTAPSLQRR